MGSFAKLVAQHGISVVTLVRISKRLEAHGPADRDLAARRERKRASSKEGSYADAGIGKPSSGRGVGTRLVEAACAGVSLSPKVRSKLVRAVNDVLARKGIAAVDVQSLFGDVRSTRAAKAND